jgi:hypothetical protein
MVSLRPCTVVCSLGTFLKCIATSMSARCPTFASAFWTLTWVHCTSKENEYRVFLCPAVFDVSSNPGNPISSLLVVTADKPSLARQTRTTCSFSVWRTCVVASPCAFTDTWSCPSTCICWHCPTQAKGRLEWATRPRYLLNLPKSRERRLQTWPFPLGLTH